MKKISVIQIGEICGVSRSTVSYWIAKRSLPALRSGNKHMVSVNDLIFFLKSEGRAMPPALLDMMNGNHCLPFIAFKNCWEYWENDNHGTRCRSCSVFTHRIQPCFTAGDNRMQLCPHNCRQCQYYTEYYEPQTAFIHQIDKAAAIYQDLYFWDGNREWAELCGVDIKKIPGVGIEALLHPQSLKNFLKFFKRITQGDITAPDKCEVVLNYKENRMKAVFISIILLKTPPGAWLMLAERVGKKFIFQ